MGNASILRVSGSGDDVEAFRKLGQLITVRHPDFHIRLEALEETINVAVNLFRFEICMTVLPRNASNDIVIA
jgi:hypothetical protein